MENEHTVAFADASAVAHCQRAMPCKHVAQHLGGQRRRTGGPLVLSPKRASVTCGTRTRHTVPGLNDGVAAEEIMGTAHLNVIPWRKRDL